MKKFVKGEFSGKDFISVALKLAYRALEQDLHKLTPRDILSLGNFIYGASQFPIIVKGLYVEFGLEYYEGDASFSERVFLTFTLSEESFRWLHKIYSYDQAFGSDSVLMSTYEESADGFIESHNAYDITDIENNIDNFRELGAKYYFEDLSNLSMEELHIEDDLEEDE